MGMGHVPQDPVHPVGEGTQFQGRQRRGTSLGRRAGPDSVAAPRLARGRWAEQLAADWYEAHGFTVVARNWTTRGGELDVVARRGPLIVVCEVKARSNLSFGDPAESVTAQKQQRVRRTAFVFIRTLGESGLRVRFDVARVLGTSLEIIEDAF